MMEIRRKDQALALGRYEELGGSNPSIFAFLREHSLSHHPQPVQLDLSKHVNGHVPIELTGGTASRNVGARPYFLTLAGYGSYWFSIVPARASVSRPRKNNGGASSALHHARLAGDGTPTENGSFVRA